MTKKEKSVFTVFIIFIVALISVTVVASFYASNNNKQAETLPVLASTLEKNISIDEAKNIALGHCNQQNNTNIVFTSQKLDYDDGREIYELEFNDGVNEYDYDISANSGVIVKYSVEALNAD